MFGNNSTIVEDDNSTAVNGTTHTPPSPQEIIPILVFLSIAIFLTVFGNGFTIYAFIRFQDLRTPFNAFIFNLAIADFFVGIIVMPCFAIYNYHGYWPLGEPLCSIWIFTDWYMTFESVVTLAVISMERLWSVRWPIHYKQTNSLKNIAFLILGTWTGVSCVWMPGYFIDRLRPGNVAEDCAFDPAKNFTAGVCVGLLGYLIPYVFMMVCYVYVGWKMRKRLRGILPKALGGRSTATSYIQKATSFSAKETNGQQIFSISPTISQRENAACRLRAVDLDEENAEEMARKAKKAAAKVTLSRERSVLLTLGAIVLAFTICWIPFYLYFFVTLFQWAELPVWFATLTYWTAYLNSAMNPILYTALHRDFRNKFLQTLKAVFSKDVGVTTPKH